jgi:glyoxylase-like metal-dependent hydrolase (beta-lactamase superfamily II)
VRIGRRCAAADAVLLRHACRTAVLITAWNPLSRRKPQGWNDRMQSRLLAAVRRYRVLPSHGGARRWAEDHLLVLMPPARAGVLARRFRQNAVVVLRAGRPAWLKWTGPGVV